MDTIEKIFEAVYKEKRTYLMEHESKAVLDLCGCRTTGAHAASNADEAVSIANRIGYPVVLKVLSKEIIHKSDLGGVKLNLVNEKDVRNAYEEILDVFRDKGMIGVSVQKMVDQGIEVIVGVTYDETFGPMIMFGLGGIFVEILKDVIFRPVPVNEKEADAMIREIKGYKILKGYRGLKGDIDSLKELIIKISSFVERFPVVKEIDLNPTYVYPEGYMIVDARIVLHESLHNEQLIEEGTSSSKDLRPIFYPESIAVIGASNTQGKLGWNVFHNLLTHGYKGRLYAVNPKADNVQGVKSYPTIKDVPDKIDVGVVLVPAELTPDTIEDCCKVGIRYIVIESAGFAELGLEGKRIEERIKEIIKKYGCRVVGPNCSGIINTYSGVVESIGAVGELKKGNIGLIAQAGVYAAGYLWGLRKILNFGIIATIGNKIDVNETDMLDFIGNDRNIRVVCMYIEDVREGKRFLEVAKRVSKQKPVIVLKTGRTEEGKRAVSSHTASLAGNDKIYDAIFKYAGIIRARDNEHMFALAKAFSKQPMPEKDGVFVVTYAGSLGVACADAITLNGMKLLDLSPDLKSKLGRILPKYVSGLNPVDFTFDQTPDQVKAAIEVALRSENLGGFIVTIQTEKVGSYIEVLKSIDFKGKPILAVVVSKEFAIDDVIRLENAGIPVYSTPEEAAEVLATMYSKRIQRPEQTSSKCAIP